MTLHDLIIVIEALGKLLNCVDLVHSGFLEVLDCNTLTKVETLFVFRPLCEHSLAFGYVDFNVEGVAHAHLDKVLESRGHSCAE